VALGPGDLVHELNAQASSQFTHRAEWPHWREG